MHCTDALRDPDLRSSSSIAIVDGLPLYEYAMSTWVLSSGLVCWRSSLQMRWMRFHRCLTPRRWR